MKIVFMVIITVVIIINSIIATLLLACSYMKYYFQFRPMRLHINTVDKHPSANPVYITAQQMYNLSAWTLPTIFPSLGLE